MNSIYQSRGNSHPGFKDGGCCCNCVHQAILTKHPFNKTVGKGPISENMGYVCKGMEALVDSEIEKGNERYSINRKLRYAFSDNAHGYCELYVPNEEGVEITKRYWGKIKLKKNYGL